MTEGNAPKGTLYLVPTPIGNLSDITSRALEVLKEVEIVACEDTRTSGNLLSKFGIKKRLVSYHEFNERSRALQLIEALKQGESVAVITDAGTPGISDPAYRVVRAALAEQIEIIPLPGPSALLPALTASGLPTDRFMFEGFLSHKSGARTRRLEKLKDFEHTIIFYESPHRVRQTLTAMLQVFGDRQVCLAREISKKFEQFIRGSISEILSRIGESVKGEVVLVVAGSSGSEKPESESSDDE
ncbi:MAG: 16S rRNA (cytidine(1402)-2'-O)-methyltransferase [bacterium]|nr:16S rRNA (cytidine(1402)-2'-O)-methyltransferase [bacterium]